MLLAIDILRRRGLLPPSPPAEKATARQDQAGKASTYDGTRYRYRD